MSVNVQISIGELFDKWTILSIKSEKVSDPEKLIRVRNEFDMINTLVSKFFIPDNSTAELLDCNKRLWDIEDRIRHKEYLQEFDDEFIQLARNIYFENDRRAEIKYHINMITQSSIVEIKNYTNYVKSDPKET